MGAGSWSTSKWEDYASKEVRGKTDKEIYKVGGMREEFNPLSVMRESRDSEEHPNSTPIILGLDVTGSMGSILTLMAEKLGSLVTEVYARNPVTDPQILFAAVGDYHYDRSPLQVTQFESDNRIAEQLTSVYFERGGGGNDFESYPLVWYFAAKHTKCDNYEKRGKKGFLFTFGDDGFPEKLSKKEIQDVFGDTIQGDLKTIDLLDQVNREYEVYHFNLTQGSSYENRLQSQWESILGERAITVTDYTKIPEIIVSILELSAGKTVTDVVSSWDGSTAVTVENVLRKLTTRGSATETGLVEF